MNDKISCDICQCEMKLIATGFTHPPIKIYKCPICGQKKKVKGGEIVEES